VQFRSIGLHFLRVSQTKYIHHTHGWNTERQHTSRQLQ
jgi:hypothetical protein